jgi:hypothetical protein
LAFTTSPSDNILRKSCRTTNDGSLPQNLPPARIAVEDHALLELHDIAPAPVKRDPIRTAIQKGISTIRDLLGFSDYRHRSVDS